MPILQALLCFVLVALPTGNGIRIPARLVKNSLSTAKPERGHVAANNGHIINNDALHLGGSSNNTSTEISGEQGNTTRDHSGLRPRMVWKSLKVKVTEILVQLRIGVSHCLLGDHYVAFLPRDTTVDVIAKLVLEPLFFHPKHGVTLQRKASRLLLFLYDTSKKAQAIFRISALGAWGLQFQKQFGRGLEVFFLPTLLYAVYMNCIYFVAAKTQHGKPLRSNLIGPIHEEIQDRLLPCRKDNTTNTTKISMGENSTSREMGDSWSLVNSLVFGMNHIGNHIPDIDQESTGDMAFGMVMRHNDGDWDTGQFLFVFSQLKDRMRQLNADQIVLAIMQGSNAFVNSRNSFCHLFESMEFGRLLEPIP